MTISHITGGHDGSTGSSFLPGTAYAILGLLSFGAELSGYELRQLARNSLRFFYWSPAQSQIYRELRRLSGLGYVTGRKVRQERRPDKIAYSITETGRSELTRWLEQAPIAPPAIRYDSALRLFFGHLTTRDRLLALVAQHRAHLERMRAELHAVREMLTVDPSLRLAQIIADWGDHLYRHELEALDQVSAALAELTPPSGRVTVPPGTVQPLPATHETAAAQAVKPATHETTAAQAATPEGRLSAGQDHAVRGAGQGVSDPPASGGRDRTKLSE
ncbi:MAG TPA: helix-turn-helix transcriptional regulator [Streptosporangiaceae bacterium]